MRVSGRVAVVAAVAVALEDLIKGDWDNRKDAALGDFERRIFFSRGERLDTLW